MADAELISPLRKLVSGFQPQNYASQSETSSLLAFFPFLYVDAFFHIFSYMFMQQSWK